MSFTVGDSISDAVERLTTSAGAALIAGLTVAGIVQTAAEQDIARGFLEWVLDQLADPEFRDELSASELESVELVEEAINTYIAELPLAFGLSPGAAALVWLIAFVITLAIAVIAIDTFGHGRDSLDGLETDRIGWKSLNLLLGWIAFGVLFVIGTFLFVVPGLLVAIFLLFFTAAIVIDGDSFVSAFGSSYAVARSNFFGTIGIVLVCLGVFVGIWFVEGAFRAVLPALPAEIVGNLLSAVSQAVAIALVACAYVEATSDEPGGDAEW